MASGEVIHMSFRKRPKHTNTTDICISVHDMYQRLKNNALVGQNIPLIYEIPKWEVVHYSLSGLARNHLLQMLTTCTLWLISEGESGFCWIPALISNRRPSC